jgi:colanic acid biosynthesis glycosyl transferase WcaI
MKPRLIFVNRYYRPDESATSQILTDLAENLAASGIDVNVVCSRQLYENSRASLPAVQILNGVRVKRIWTTRFGRRSLPGRACDYASFYLSALAVLAGMVKRGDVVVAKTDPPMVSVVVSWAVRLRGAMLVNWLQDVFPEVLARLAPDLLPGWIYRMLLAVRNRSLRQARVNVVLGERMAQHIRRFMAEPRVAVIPNWADGTLIVPRAAKHSELRQRLGLQSSFVVGYSGNLGRAHEYATVLEAARALEWETHIVFLFIGGGARFEQLRRDVEHLGLQNFRFLPHQPRAVLSDVLAAADVHLASLLPDMEGLIVPSKAYGVLAAARPLISIGDPAGELACLVNASGCGAAIRCGDAEALVNAILELEGDAGLCSELGQRARQVYEQQYSLASALCRWRELLVSVSPDFSPATRAASAASVAPAAAAELSTGHPD